jgi:hypothetical protein
VPTEAELVADKVRAAGGSCVGHFGYAPLDRFGRWLWAACYAADPIAAIQRDAGRSVALRDDARRALEAKIQPLPSARPAMDAFARVVENAVLRRTREAAAAALLPGAREGLAALAADGYSMTMFTSGYPPHQDVKLADVGLQVVDRWGRIGGPRASDAFGPPIEVTAIIAADKLARTKDDPARLVQGERIKTLAGGRPVTLVEDRPANIVGYLESDAAARAVWVKQGAHAQRMVDGRVDPDLARVFEQLQADRRVVQLDDISGLPGTVRDLRTDTHLLIDYDDTLSDNDVRRDLDQLHAVEATQASLHSLREAEHTDPQLAKWRADRGTVDPALGAAAGGGDDRARSLDPPARARSARPGRHGGRTGGPGGRFG